MLGKLIKYDFKYGCRIFAILHIMFLGACLLGRLLYLDKIDFQAPANVLVSTLSIFISVFTLLFSAVSFGVAALLAVRFYKNLFTDEGYLTWTLPATHVQQLWAKIISGSAWYMLNITIAAAGILILLTGPNVKEAYAMVAPEVTDMLGMPLSTAAVYLLVFSLFSTTSSVIMIYASIALGQLFPGHKVLCSIITYFILYAIIQIILVFVMLALNLFPGGEMYAPNSSRAVGDYLFSTFKLSGIVFFFSTILLYLATHYITGRKLNLN